MNKSTVSLKRKLRISENSLVRSVKQIKSQLISMCLLIKDIIMGDLNDNCDLNGTTIVIVNRCTSDQRSIYVNQEPKKLE